MSPFAWLTFALRAAEPLESGRGNVDGLSPDVRPP